MSDRCERKSNGHSGYQHADHTFEWAQQVPFRRKDLVPISNGRIAAGREVKRRFLGWKAKPAIATRPQQNNDPVQIDDGYRGLHDERGAAKHPYPLTLSRAAAPPHCRESVTSRRIVEAPACCNKVIVRGRSF